MNKTLGVPYRKQRHKYSCFPAAVNMILRYYGDRISEMTLYRKATLPGLNGTCDAAIGPILIKRGYKVTTFWNGLAKDFIGSSETAVPYEKAYAKALKKGLVHRRNAAISHIKKFIDIGVPVLTEISASKFYNIKEKYTHMIVIVGYDKNNFYAHDPHHRLGKEMIKIPLPKFRKSWYHLSGGAGRSMFVIEKVKK